MCECECLCLFICVGPAMGRWPVQGVFLLAALMHAGINIIAPKWKKKKKKMVGNRRAFDAEVRWWRLHSSNSVLYVKLWMVEEVCTSIYIQTKSSNTTVWKPPITIRSSACKVTVLYTYQQIINKWCSCSQWKQVSAVYKSFFGWFNPYSWWQRYICIWNYNLQSNNNYTPRGVKHESNIFL